MDNIFKDKLQTIASDKLLITAIKAVFKERIDKEKPEIGETNDDILIGQKYRAYEKAKEIIKMGFIDLKSYQPTAKTSKNFNKER